MKKKWSVALGVAAAAVAVTAVVSVLPATAANITGSPSADQSLRDLGRRHGLYIGTAAVDMAALADPADPQYRQLVRRAVLHGDRGERDEVGVARTDSGHLQLGAGRTSWSTTRAEQPARARARTRLAATSCQGGSPRASRPAPSARTSCGSCCVSTSPTWSSTSRARSGNGMW